MRVLSKYICKADDITCDSEDININGKVLFICGMLAQVTSSDLQSAQRTSLTRTPYFTHKINSFEHIAN